MFDIQRINVANPVSVNASLKAWTNRVSGEALAALVFGKTAPSLICEGAQARRRPRSTILFSELCELCAEIGAGGSKEKCGSPT